MRGDIPLTDSSVFAVIVSILNGVVLLFSVFFRSHLQKQAEKSKELADAARMHEEETREKIKELESAGRELERRLILAEASSGYTNKVLEEIKRDISELKAYWTRKSTPGE